jgi:hypothetical protein
MAPRLVLRCEVDGNGRIVELHTILTPRKLTAVRFSGGDSTSSGTSAFRPEA